MVCNEKLADAYCDLEGDLRQIRRLTGLACRLFMELASTDADPEDGEEVGALMIALRSLAVEIERKWDEAWLAAGGRS